MILNLRPFRVLDKTSRKFLEGRFIITVEGKLKKEIPYRDPTFPNVEHTLIEDIDADNLEIVFN